MGTRKATVWAAGFLALTAQQLTSAQPRPEPGAPLSGAVVATVNGSAVTADELERLIQAQLRPLEERVRQLRSSALQSLISEVLLRQEAERRGTTLSELLSEVGSGARVEPAEVEAAYESGRGQFPGVPEFEAKEQIRENLTRRRRSEAYQRLIEALRSRADVRVFLPGPSRIEVPLDSRTDPVLGSEKAAVTIIQFSDFECAWSRKAQEGLRKAISEKGEKIRLVFKHFPLADARDSVPGGARRHVRTPAGSLLGVSRPIVLRGPAVCSRDAGAPGWLDRPGRAPVC